MKFKNVVCVVAISPIMLALASAPVWSEETTPENEDFRYDFYMSLRMQAESVHPDRQIQMNDYRGLRDAFSRVGINAAYRLSDDTLLFGQLEVPFDSVKGRLGDSYDQGGSGRDDREMFRIARIGLESSIGTVIAGQQWMPYYNAITYPVDQFSTFYSGFATYTTFRVKETLTYLSPTINGFSVGGSYSSAAGNKRSPSRIDDRRIQAVASYTFERTVLAIGMDDRGNAAGYTDRIYGFSASHRIGDWNIAFKYETTENTDPNSAYQDGAEAFNFYGEYRSGKNTYRAMLANVESYGDAIIHLGIDHRYSGNLTLFTEFYQEQETAAITGKQEGLAGFNSGISGGKVIAAGFRYNFDF